MDIGGVWVYSEIDESAFLDRGALDSGGAVQGMFRAKCKRVFWRSGRCSGDLGRNCRPTSPNPRLASADRFPFRQNKGLNDKSQFLGATHQPCSFPAWAYQGSLVLNGWRSSLVRTWGLRTARQHLSERTRRNPDDIRVQST